MGDDRPYRVYRGGSGGGDPKPDEPPLRIETAPPADSGAVAPWEGEDDIAPAPVRRGPVVLPPTGAPPAPPGPPAAPARAPKGPRRRRRIGRIIGWVLLVVILLLVGWLTLGYLAFRSAVRDANARFDAIKPAVAPVLTTQHGLLLGTPSNILVLGADRTGHSDSLQIIHTDPGKHLVATLALPRDLIVDIPGHGPDKLNAAYAVGGPALAVRAVQRLTGLKINHVIVVDFTGFVELIDAVGGVDVVSPKALRSNFDGYTYRFPRGAVHLDGKHALAYSRIRKNQLDPADSDVTRGQRQQQVMSALKGKLASPSTVFHLRSAAAAAVKPLSTDLSANQLLSFGWVELRAQRKLSCNFGGDPSPINGASGLAPNVARNLEVVAMLLGKAALKPAPSSKVDPFAPACRKGG